jgi:hypothetical protein
MVPHNVSMIMGSEHSNQDPVNGDAFHQRRSLTCSNTGLFSLD